MKGSIVVVFVLAAAVVMVTSDSTAQWNDIADVLLDHAKVELQKRGREELELNDFEHSIDKKFSFIKVRGVLKAEGGWLRDVTTARRVGDVTTERVGSALKVGTTVSWGELRLGYRHYRLDIGRVFEGSLEVNVKSNAVMAIFSFDMVDGRCRTQVDQITVLDLSDLDVTIRGLGFLNFIAEHLVKWFLDSRKEDITEKLEEMFKEAIPEHLEDFQCDEYAALLMIEF